MKDEDAFWAKIVLVVLASFVTAYFVLDYLIPKILTICERLS